MEMPIENYSIIGGSFIEVRWHMNELNVLCSICLDVHENETRDEALERLREILNSELCNLADHHISYQIHEVFEQRRDGYESTAEESIC